MRSRQILLGIAIFAAVLPTNGAVLFSPQEPSWPVPPPIPALEEIRSIILTNLIGATSAELDRAALNGILSGLEGKIELVSAPVAPLSRTSAPLINKTAVYDNDYGYLRVDRVSAGLAKEFDSTFANLRIGGELEGLILDLRFAKGVDYSEAASLVDRFLKKEKKLLKVGARTIWSTAKRNAISVPVAVLVNSKTVGSAEALAALMRRSNVGLLIGADTAGGVSQFREFTLSNGQRLRVATGPLLFGEGEVLVGGAVQPDIEIDVAVEDELAYLDNAYRILPDDLSTLQAELEPNPFRPLSEAEIVRRHKLEQGEESVIEEKFEDVEAPLESEIRDPALSRALDVLKALAVVRKIHPF
jgi:hypothetical protein